MFTIQFYYDEKLIGKETYSDIFEIKTLNLEKYDNLSFYYKFKNLDNYHWHVISKNIDFENNVIKITLDEYKRGLSLKEYSINEGKGINFYLKPYSIVDVNFGFYKSIIDAESGLVEKNFSFLDKLIYGEMHKQRPCIVLKVLDDAVQVVPLSTNDENDDEYIIHLSDLININEFYKEKTSYIIPSMIQTVSPYRVFPVKSHKGKRQHIYHEHIISSKMQKQIDLLIAREFNDKVFKENSLLSKEKEKLSQEKFRILSTNNKLKEENKEMTEFIFSVKKTFGLDGDNIHEQKLYFLIF